MAPTPEMVEASRRAAALWTHWNRDDRAGALAIFDEVTGDADDPVTLASDFRWRHFALALLELGTNMAKAAAAGKADEHLAYVLRASAVDETTGEYRP